jgi:hypothetical protein
MRSLLVLVTITLGLNILSVKASDPLYIRADGSIDPSGVGISTSDNITYTFTNNMTCARLMPNVSVEGSQSIAMNYSTSTTYNTGSSSNFSIFWITDTQYLSSTYPQKFNDLAKWIIHEASYYNAKMVVHTGDIVDNPSATSQWDAANAAMSMLLNNNTPYCWCAGNHDQLPMGNPNTDWIGSQYRAFNLTIMEHKSYWVSDICDGKDTAVHFNVNNVDILIIDIEYQANNTVLAWVNNLLNTYPYANTILATHCYIDHSLNYHKPWASTLNSSVLATHSNVLMTLNGHDHGDSGAHQTVENISELVFDRQDSENYMGAATVTILTFDTVDNQITVKTYDVNTGQFRTDPNDQFTLATTLRARALVGDLTGGSANPWDFIPDGKVDGKDIAIVALCYGSAPGCPPPHVWNSKCDVNNDGKVDGKDITIVALHFGQAGP